MGSVGRRLKDIQKSRVVLFNYDLNKILAAKYYNLLSLSDQLKTLDRENITICSKHMFKTF